MNVSTNLRVEKKLLYIGCNLTEVPREYKNKDNHK